MNVGEMIREVRLRRGLTQKELAVLLGCRQAWVSYLELSQTCSLRTLERVASVMGVELRVQLIELRLPEGE